MYSRAVKEELTIALKRILKQTSLKFVESEIEEIADQYGLDLTEIDPEDEEGEFQDAYLEDGEIENLNDDDEDYEW